MEEVEEEVRTLNMHTNYKSLKKVVVSLLAIAFVEK